MSARKPPAGAPADWQARPPAGTPGGDPKPPAAEDKAPSARDQGEQVEHDFDALLADVKRERDEYLELAQRARADFENYRKRATRETEEAERRGRAAIARDLLPALDNLERALTAAGVPVDQPASDPAAPAREGEEAAGPISEEVSARDALAHGVALVHRELLGALERAGVEGYDPSGELFDPAWHEALTTRSQDGVEAGVVLETLEKGYRLDGQVLRAARVVVSE